MRPIIYCFFANIYLMSTIVVAANIHEILISTGCFEGIDINVWTTIGTKTNGVCNYQKDTDKVLWTIYKDKYLYLNSDTLKTMIGSGYTCAKTNVQKAIGGQIYYSSFDLLLNDAKDEYIGSNPSSTDIGIYS